MNPTSRSLVHDFLSTSFQQALESTSLKDSVDPFIETLRSVVKADQTFDERSQAINHIMKELSIALHLFPDMKAVELAPFISQLYILACSHKMTLTEYLTYLKKIKSLNWPYEGLHAFMDDELVAKLSVRKDMRAIGFVDSNHQSYREIIKFALRYNGRALQKLDLSLRNDPEIVRLAIEQDPLAIFYASHELQSNKELAKLAIAKHELSLGLIKIFSDDFEMVTFAVRHHGKALDGASPRLQNCREIVELAILQNREAFAYASPELQKDPQLRALAKLPPKKKQGKVERFFSKITSLFKRSSRQA